ncbi:ATP-binding protein, partial [Escherichia coli]|nr:ATP-binding protein [Escherichia coli]
MGTPVLILGDSGAGKSYSPRNFNPDDVMLLQCIPKMLPFKSAGWKLHGKQLADGSKQRGNVLRSDNWETVLDTI